MYLAKQRFVSLVEFLAAIITQLAKDLAERRPKNNILTSIGSVFSLMNLLVKLVSTWVWRSGNRSIVFINFYDKKYQSCYTTVYYDMIANGFKDRTWWVRA